MSDDTSGELFKDLFPAHPKRSERPVREPRPPKEEPPAPIYLWLCCEGWVRFGPFEWLCFDTESAAVFDSRGNVAAWREGSDWRVADPRGANMAFDAITITTARNHPFRNTGAPEFLHEARQRLADIRK